VSQTRKSQRFIEPVVQQSTPGMIADRVREAIGHGEIAPGEQLLEASLARELGVSRGPLREGLQRLTQEGLLISIRNRGLFVIEMTPENVRDMYVAREAVERAAAVCVHRHDGERTAAALHAVVDRMAEAAAAGDEVEVSDWDIEFHEVLVAEAHSPRLSRIHQTLLTETRMCVHALEETYTRTGTRVSEHRAIADAIGAGDPEQTDRLLRIHMADAVNRLVQAHPSTD
jgi:DNA-binding GntR family transcriptional regulator